MSPSAPHLCTPNTFAYLCLRGRVPLALSGMHVLIINPAFCSRIELLPAFKEGCINALCTVIPCQVSCGICEVVCLDPLPVERFAWSKNIPSGAAGDPASLDEPPASLSPRRAARMAFVSSFSFWREETKEQRGEEKLDKERVHYIETTKRMEEKGVERETNGCKGCICTDTAETRRDRRELRRNEWMWRLQMYKLVWARRQRNEWKIRELRGRNEGCRCTNSHGRGDNETNGREGN